jgi:hypothetical protein
MAVILKFVMITCVLQYADADFSGFGNESVTRRLDTRETVRIGSYNTLVGFLNWHEPWFQTYMNENCRTKCIFSMNPADVCVNVTFFYLTNCGEGEKFRCHFVFGIHLQPQSPSISK